MALNPQRGAGMGTPTIFPVPQSAQAYGTSINQGAGPFALAAGETYIIPPGQFGVVTGGATSLQMLDPVSGIWRNYAGSGLNRTILSDGTNFRLANLTGCAVGALVTNVGSGYTTAPTVTASAGGSTWQAIVGGAINSTVTITTAGAGYSYPPTLIISPPPPGPSAAAVGGIQATATCTVSGGAINAVTVVNQGAGYTSAPTITVLPDPRDAAAGTITTPAVLTVNSTLAGSGTITAVICTNQGTPQTAVPTLSFSGGGGSSAAATAVMCFVLTGFTVGAGGAAYGNAQPFLILAEGGGVTATPGAVVNPAVSTALVSLQSGAIVGTSTAGGAVTATGSVISRAGLFQAVPNGYVIAGGSGLATTVAQVTLTVGGTSDTSFLYPI